ncbi:DsrH/TusB family sulfur relay protein [Marinomonas fungiae]|uniref:Sulfur transfer complex TusBCD TusB component, DsrH family n=1 Tax=Marinomonas fungiae TaxID=1137284 RepID=A0A0K6IHJ2_9GAMM|nr:DsrH/TusB family sulfur metabolism protein [Marinomonas fungiae]CUB02546.1 Sulfur transfer complex TusBCD TusB component, DsrH family [Marinomonas fungiae]
MKLYQVNQYQYPKSVEDDWINSLSAGDAVLLLEAGVLRALSQPKLFNTLQEKQVKLFWRQTDLKAYGIQAITGEAISDLEWVELTQEYSKIVAW